MDRRRRQWVPLAVTFAHGSTGERLKERYGRDGLLVWVCYLAACKANWIQGQMTYTSEADGWQRLGLTGHEPDFTLEAFFTFTGQLKQTRIRRTGHVKDTVCTHWGQWNDQIRRERDAERKASKRHGITQTLDGRSGDETKTKRGTDVDVDVESETPLPPFPEKTATSRPVCPECGVSFKSKNGLAEHAYHSHNGPEPAHWIDAEAKATR